MVSAKMARRILRAEKIYMVELLKDGNMEVKRRRLLVERGGGGGHPRVSS